MISYPAQIVFTESDRGGAWCGRLLNPRGCVDMQNYGKPVTGTPFFKIRECDNGRFHATMQGGHKSGRRYQTYDTLNEAQRAGIRWAGRRFRVLVEKEEGQ